MDDGYLWLVPVSLFCTSSVFVVFRRALVPWLCRRLLQHKAPLVLHGVATQQHQQGNGLDQANVKSGVTEGDVLELSLLVLTGLTGVANAVVSVIAFMETWRDTIFSRSAVLIPWAHIMAWYYVVDTYAMFTAFVAKRNLSHLHHKTILILFARSNWLFLLHHFLLIVVGYPMVVNASFRGYKGDFFVAAVLAQDFSNPLPVNAKIMKILGLTKNVFYHINGAALIVVFLLVRVLNMPVCILVYAGQYHQWNLVAALSHMRWSCFAGISLIILVQTCWFMTILKLAGNVVTSRWKDK